jgi:hypothetical protein
MQPDATSLEVKHQSGLSKVCVLREHVEAAPRIAESLGSLGVAAIMTNAAHEARVAATAPDILRIAGKLYLQMVNEQVV